MRGEVEQHAAPRRSFSFPLRHRIRQHELAERRLYSVYPADSPVTEDLPCLFEQRMKPAVEAEAHGHPRPRRSIDDALSLAGRESERLLEVDVLARLARRNHELSMEMSRPAHDHCVHVLAREQIFRAGIHVDPRERRGTLSRVEIGI